MKQYLRSTCFALLAVCAPLVAKPAQASVVFNVTGAWSDGGTLSGTFTTSNDLLGLEATSLLVSGGTNGIDPVLYNEADYIVAGSNNLPNGFFLNAVSSVTKTLRLNFASPLSTSQTTLLQTSSSNTQNGVQSRTLRSGSVTPQIIVSSVPEPATWGMMILGFMVAGHAMRRRYTTVDRLSYAT